MVPNPAVLNALILGNRNSLFANTMLIGQPLASPDRVLTLRLLERLKVCPPLFGALKMG